MNIEIEKKITDYINRVDEYLEKCVEVIYPEKIYESMRYSLLAGGKRIRPVMVIESASVTGCKFENILPVAAAVEMLHCQSLIHDDLPCMDDDDLRRGKPSNHKMFGEDVAVLSGDALLSFAPQLIINKLKDSVSSDTILRILNEFFDAAGVNGIISGQIVDMLSENKTITPETLDYIHEYKTARLFKLAVRSGAMLSGASDAVINALTLYAEAFGHAFQIYDDVKDVTSTSEQLGKTPGKDVNAGKATYVSLFGLQKSKEKALFLCNRSCDILLDAGIKSDILFAFVQSIREGINKCC